MPRPILGTLRRQFFDALLGVGVTIALFALLEGVLALTGAGRAEERASLSGGFDPSTSYLIPDPDAPGSFSTRYLGRNPEFRIPPKSNRTRVLLFGGSNTQGFNSSYLERQLARAVGVTDSGDGELPFEVINLGRSGYGTGRVSLVFRQALAHLDPDVVVIYAGHNEFLERSFEIDVEGAWSSGWMRDAAEWWGATRTGTLVTGLVTEPAPLPRHERPDAWASEYAKFSDLTYEQTLEFWDAYEGHLRDMCSAARESGVRVLLSTVVYNRFSPPRVSTPNGLDEEQLAALNKHLARARNLLPATLRPLSPVRPADRVHGFDWGGPSSHLPEGEVQEPLPEGRPSSGLLAGRSPGYPADRPWKAKVRALYVALHELYQGAHEHELDALAKCVTQLDAALALAPDHARALYDSALIEYYLGARGAEVRARFVDSARFDRAPRKANEASNGRVRAIAASASDVLFVDTDREFSSCSESGLVGWEWMKDHCHLQRGAIDVVLERFAEAIVARWYSGEDAAAAGGDGVEEGSDE